MLSGTSTGSPATRSLEDQDLLERSTKKSKTGEIEMENSSNIDVDLEMGQEGGLEATTQTANEKMNAHGVVNMGNGEGSRERENGFKFQVSYKNVVAGRANQKGVYVVEDEVSDDESGDESQDDPTCPKIRLTKEEKIWIRAPWKQTLIIKVMGRSVGYTYLLRRITALWRPKGKMELVAIDNDYFLVKFSSVEDYEYAKYEGPWMVMDHYLIVKEWVPNFDPLRDTTEKVIMWVRLPGLPAEYYNRIFLWKIGKRIGTPIKIDEATSLVSRGKYARLCVEVDITKPLLARFKLREEIKRIEYEGVHLVCFKCGMYGHMSDKCGKQAIERNSSELHEEGGAGVNTASTSYGKDRTLIDKVLPLQRPEASETFGPWMIAKKPARRNSRNNGMVTGKGNGSRIKEHNEKIGESSRFAVLEEETGEDIENIDYEQTHHNELNSKKKGKQPMSKGRRPNVQVSEINNIANKGISIKADNQGNQHKSSTSHDGNMNAKGGRPNQAAALDEHTVVRGENNGAVITSERIVHNDQDSVMLENDHNFDPGTLEANTEEHFSDPPTTTNDIADDFVDGDECWEGASESLHEEMDLTV